MFILWPKNVSTEEKKSTWSGIEKQKNFSKLKINDDFLEESRT